MSRTRDESLTAAFAATLIDLRTARGLSQEALAHEAEIDRAYVSMLERAKRQPSLRVIFSLALALGVMPETLIKQTRVRLSS